MATNRMIKYRGDDYGIALNFTDSSDVAIDITGWTIFYTVKSKITDADADAVISKTVTSHTNPTGGATRVSVADTDTDDLEGDYYYDLSLKKTDGTINTIVSGVITFKPDVTIRTS